MKDHEPTVRSRDLGVGLRRVMESAGFNGTQIAWALGWSQGRVSRLLSGKRGGSAADVSAFLAVCGVTGAERDRLTGLCAERNLPGRLVHHGPMGPGPVGTLVDLETASVAISEFQTTLVPGLLQTAGYTRAMVPHSPTVPQDRSDARDEVWLARLEWLASRRAPACTFFLHEHVLRLPIGGAAVMSDQLHFLLRLSVRPNLTIRVVPAHLGAHPGLAGPFTLLEVRDFKPIVYLDSATTSLFLETPTEIDTYRTILTALDHAALDQRQSRELITTVAHAFGEDTGSH